MVTTTAALKVTYKAVFTEVIAQYAGALAIGITAPSLA
jgi:hypothetical protein